MKKTNSLNSLFTFNESEKSLKKTPLGFIFAMNEFNEPENKKKQLRILALGLESTTKMSKLVLSDFFPFYEVKKVKKNLSITKNF